MKFLLIALALLFVGLLLSPGLISGANGTTNKDSTGAAERPFIIFEASHPEDFPSPGPVGEVIMKDYPPYRAARVADEDIRQNSMFRTLFKHIKRNEIAMTAPVQMTYDDEGPTSMAFLYGNRGIGETGKHDDVHVLDFPAEKVVSVGVRGNFDTATFKSHRRLLEEWLEQNSDRWVAAGEPRYFGFNSPFVPGLLRYGEVQIPVKEVARAELPEAKDRS